MLLYQGVFSSAGELIVGLYLLFQFRQFERHWGSRRYGSFVLLSGTLSASLSLSALSLLKDSPMRLTALPGGPYGLIFASLVQYFFDIPVSFPMHVMGITLSDKTVNYLLAAQLMLNAPPHSVVASLIGIAVGMAYRVDALKLRKFTLPAFFVKICSKIFLPFLQANNERQRGRQWGGRPDDLGGGEGALGGRRVQQGTQGYRDTLLGNPFVGGGAGRGGYVGIRPNLAPRPVSFLSFSPFSLLPPFTHPPFLPVLLFLFPSSFLS